MARPLKKRMGDWLALHAGIPVAFWLFKMIGWTMRRRRGGRHEAFYGELERGGNGCIFAFWHGDSFYMADEMRHVFKYGDFYIMASQSRDGALMAKFLEMAGAKTRRGSSSRGGLKAMLALIKVIRPNDFGTLAVDAPRGPRHCVNTSGILLLAQRTGLPVVPLTGYADRKWVVRSWDRLEFPKFFSRTSVTYGEPIHVPKKADADEIERLRVLLEQRLRGIKIDDVEEAA